LVSGNLSGNLLKIPVRNIFSYYLICIIYLVLNESEGRISIQLFTISMDTFEVIFYFRGIAKVTLIAPLVRHAFLPGKG
jgi:hypothetical protein